MTFSFFSFNQIIPLLPSIVLLIGSVFFFRKNKNKTSLVFLFSGAIGLGCFIALLDPFLNTWDEQFHALVAKHTMENPFIPKLFSNPILDYDYRNWCKNSIWLHKQPLFLWQMALSMKLFGINVFALRLPSLLMHAVIPLFIYRIGKITISREVGFYGAMFFTVAYFPLELVAGKVGTDHNDIAFLFYITASFWAWFEYMKSKKRYWLILIGLFSGCAVLVKWLMGLLVYVCWAFTFVAKKQNLFNVRSYFPMMLSFFISLVVFVPWQIYISFQFPNESFYEYSTFSSHLFKVIEGHGGNFWFHFNAIDKLYGSGFFVPVFLILALIVMFRKINSPEYKIVVFGSIAFVYLFYSFAATKITSFCIIVSPFLFLAFASLFIFVMDFANKKINKEWLRSVVFIGLLVLLCLALFNINKIQKNHTMYTMQENGNRKGELEEIALINKVKNILPDSNFVIFNFNQTLHGNIALMFYTDYTAYDFIPTEKQCSLVINKGYKIAVIDFGDLPDYLINNKDIIKIKAAK
jgi:4-amino-4-deoxy-L-arabinose transferase